MIYFVIYSQIRGSFAKGSSKNFSLRHHAIYCTINSTKPLFNLFIIDMCQCIPNESNDLQKNHNQTCSQKHNKRNTNELKKKQVD